MCLEITDGMDLHSYNGPVVERTAYKAGLIKAGTSYRLITHLEQKALRIAAMTQRETGCAISIHTEMGRWGHRYWIYWLRQVLIWKRPSFATSSAIRTWCTIKTTGPRRSSLHRRGKQAPPAF